MHPKSALLLLVFLTPAMTAQAKEPQTLLTRVFEWQYPGSQVGESTMSDAATIDKQGNRTVPSTHCSTVFTSPDSVAKVVKHYRAKLAPKNDQADDKKSITLEPGGRSVTFLSDTQQRPLKVEMIFVNTSNTSTTLVISRGSDEAETHIAWSQYERHVIKNTK